MNIPYIIYILGWILNIEGAFMMVPVIAACAFGEGEGWYYGICAVLCILVGCLIVRKKPYNTEFYAKEGFTLVALSWIIMGTVGALPIFASGEIPNFVDALFEIVSGFTTTGARVVPNVELLSNASNLWRCFTHWSGGMGVLVFLLALIPQNGGQSLYIMKAESPGPSVGKLVPKLQETAKYLYIIYFAITFLEFLCLLIAGMPLFDSVCTAFGTAGTGGFGIKADSMAGYTYSIQVIVTIFMVLFGVNFNFYFYIIMRKISDAFKLSEVKWYFIIYFVSSLLIIWNLTATGTGAGDIATDAKDAFFQVGTVMTTTGYATTNFDAWHSFSKTLLVVLMFVGACAGSTGGGMKVSRIMIYFKAAKRELSQTIHPREVKAIKMDGKAIDKDIIKTAHMYLGAYAFIFFISFLIISLDGFDVTTNFTAVTATINNIGPGLGAVGPTGNFADFSIWSKLVMIFDMLAGRLEVFPMLLLFFPATWRKKG